MYNFSEKLSKQLESKNTYPVWLLEISFPNTDQTYTIRLADRYLKLDQTIWYPVIESITPIDSYFDPGVKISNISDVTVNLYNHKEFTDTDSETISSYINKYHTKESHATLYIWFDNADLKKPSGNELGDLLPVLSGRIEIGREITSYICPIDIIADYGPFSKAMNLADLTSGRYSKRQWPFISDQYIGKVKPIAIGSEVYVKGIPLASSKIAGRLVGPASLFDPSRGSDNIEILFRGTVDLEEIPPTPTIIYIGDWYLHVSKSPAYLGNGIYRYKPDIYKNGSNKFYIPESFKNITTIFSLSQNWSTNSLISDRYGPFGYRSNTANGIPFQFYHGDQDSGNFIDGISNGRFRGEIKNIYADGTELDKDEFEVDDSFGIAWIKGSKGYGNSNIVNPGKIDIRWTKPTANSDKNIHFNPEMLTVANMRNYNAKITPIIAGNFFINSSAGIAPVNNILELSFDPVYPNIGSEIISARLVIRYTAVEISEGDFAIEIFNSNIRFPVGELINADRILNDGWSLSMISAGNKNTNSENSPVNRSKRNFNNFDWSTYEISKDMKDQFLNEMKQNGGLTSKIKISFLDNVWPKTNSMIILYTGLEIEYFPISNIGNNPNISALVSTSHFSAGEILKDLIPNDIAGEGYDDPTLPKLNFYITKRKTISSLAINILDMIPAIISYDYKSKKWDLVKINQYDVSDILNEKNFADNISDDDILADENGTPTIKMIRTNHTEIINELTLNYISKNGFADTVTVRDHDSIKKLGTKIEVMDTNIEMSYDEAISYANKTLLSKSNIKIFYSFIIPIGRALSLQPGDYIKLSSSLNNLINTEMRVISIDIYPGKIKSNKLSVAKINAQQLNSFRIGFGNFPFGKIPFGTPLIVEY